MLGRIGICIATFLAGMGMAQAHDLSPDKNTAFHITPYGWITGMEGRLSPFRQLPTVRVKKSFSDVFENLNLASFLDLRARYDRFVFAGDFLYVNTSQADAIDPLPAFPPFVPAGLGVWGKIDSRILMASAMAGYRVYDAPKLAIDAVAGARMWHVSNDVKVNLAGFTAKHNESFNWVDPQIGMRVFTPFNEHWSLQAQGSYGGFGVQSKKTWSAEMTVNYAFNKRISASAGYKLLAVDYARDGHVFDTRFKGPVAGVTIWF